MFPVMLIYFIHTIKNCFVKIMSKLNTTSTFISSRLTIISKCQKSIIALGINSHTIINKNNFF